MNRRLLLCIAVLLSGIVVFASGCQSNEVKEQIGTSSQEVPSVPYSKGPTSPPYVRGPSGPPPQSPKPAAAKSSDSQAVTETETVRYSLPENPDVKVKQ